MCRVFNKRCLLKNKKSRKWIYRGGGRVYSVISSEMDSRY